MWRYCGVFAGALALFLFAGDCSRKTEQIKGPHRKNLRGRAKVGRPTKPLSELITSKKPRFPGPYAGLAFGMNRAQAKKAAFGVFGGNLGRIVSQEFAGVVFHEPWFDRKTGGLKSITLHFERPEKIRSVLTAAWGKPARIKDHGKRVLLWFNPKDRIRASLRPFNSGKANLDFHPYVPVRAFLGQGKGFAFEEKQLIGIPVDRVAKDYPRNFRKRGKHKVELMFPPMEYDFVYGVADWTTVDVLHKRGRTTGMRFRLKFGTCPSARKFLFNLLRQKFGEPARKTIPRSRQPVWVFNIKPLVTVTKQKRFWQVQVGGG